jgi:hypothetical protein
MLKCWNDAGPSNGSPLTSWSTVFAGAAAASGLRAAGAWWSNPASPSSAATSPIVTATASGAVARIQQLYNLCRSWPGPLSVVMLHAFVVEGGTDTNNTADAAASSPASDQLSEYQRGQMRDSIAMVCTRGRAFVRVCACATERVACEGLSSSS